MVGWLAGLFERCVVTQTLSIETLATVEAVVSAFWSYVQVIYRPCVVVIVVVVAAIPFLVAVIPVLIVVIAVTDVIPGVAVV